MLIDAGGGSSSKRVVDYLKASGVNRIDYLVATHPHEDHIGGMAAVIKSFEIGKIYFPRVIHNTRTFENLLDAIAAKNLQINTAKAGVELIKSENLSLAFVAPIGEKYDNLNNYSAVVRLVFSNTAFLFTGDAESLVENEMLTSNYDIRANVLKVGHHGSNTSTSQRFLSAVKPSVAVISVGTGNSYRHPAQAVLTRLNNDKVSIYRTDKNGTITVTSDGEKLSVVTQKKG